jgi:type IV secretory pathway VirB4 component
MSATIIRLFDAAIIERSPDPLTIPLPPAETSLRLHHHTSSDVGHACIVGRTGGGKTAWLGELFQQLKTPSSWLR